MVALYKTKLCLYCNEGIYYELSKQSQRKWNFIRNSLKHCQWLQ